MESKLDREDPAFSVAVCIPTFNQAPYLSQAVESAFTQTYPGVEVWVADDCSTDHTPQVMEELLKRYPHRLHYHRHPENLGVTGNSNWLLAQPRTDFIARLDSDDFLEPAYLEELLELMERHPSAGYAHCAVQEVDKDNKPRRIRRLGGRGEYQDADTSLRAMIHGYRVAANICLFRASALCKVSYYRAGINFTEDWDLAVRIADAEFGNVYTNTVLANYRVWVEAVRPKRKLIEIKGCISVYEDVLTPAFEKRDWDMNPLLLSKQSIAMSQVMALASPRFTVEERHQAISLLKRLGDSKSLRRRIQLLELGFGPVIRMTGTVKLYLRDKAKATLLKFPQLQRLCGRN